LLQHVRTDLGLAYGVFSNLDAPYSHRGTFFMECQTKCTTTLQAIEAMRAELARLTSERASAEELRIAKESILQSLIFASESRKGRRRRRRRPRAPRRRRGRRRSSRRRSRRTAAARRSRR